MSNNPFYHGESVMLMDSRDHPVKPIVITRITPTGQLVTDYKFGHTTTKFSQDGSGKGAVGEAGWKIRRITASLRALLQQKNYYKRLIQEVSCAFDLDDPHWMAKTYTVDQLQRIREICVEAGTVAT